MIRVNSRKKDAGSQGTKGKAQSRLWASRLVTYDLLGICSFLVRLWHGTDAQASTEQGKRLG